MESSSGSDTAAPNPRSTARREMCFLVTNIVNSPHLKGHALHDAHYDCGKPVILARSIPVDRSYNRHVVILEPAAQRVRQQFLGERADEGIRVAHQRLAQTGRAVHVSAVDKLPGRVNRFPRVTNSPD